MNIHAHIAASSTKKADDTYAAQAVAYRAFETASRLTLCRQSADTTPLVPATRERERVARSNKRVLDPSTSTSYVDNTQQAARALDSQLFTIPSTAFLPGRRHLAEPTLSTVSAHGKKRAAASPLSSNEAYNSPGGLKLTTPLQQTGSDETSSSHLRTPIFDRTARRPRTVNHGLPPSMILQPAKSLLQGSPPEPRYSSDSELPTTYSLSDITPDRSKSAGQARDRALSDPGIAFEPGSSLEPWSPLLQRRHPPVDRIALLSQPAVAAGTVIPQTVYSSSSRETKIILPSAAPFGTDSFTSHVSGRLPLLVSAPGLTGIYKPKHTTRSLLPSERGRWTFSMRSMNAELCQECWTFLERFISSGFAGWGVWCVLNPYNDQLSQNHDIIVAHCWGEIVEHIYLLLVVATSTEIRKVGAQFIDSDGEVVIQM